MSLDLSNYHDKIRMLQGELRQTQTDKIEYFRLWQQAQALNTTLEQRCTRLEAQLKAALALK